jgi:hypothetical protein
MSAKDAEDRFIEAVHAFKDADEKARKDMKRGVNKKVFQLVLIDLDAAIPGLEGRMLGHAYGFKASCYDWIRTAEVMEAAKGSRLFDVYASRKSPTRAAGLSAAKKARSILAKIPNEDLGWIEDLIEQLK